MEILLEDTCKLEEDSTLSNPPPSAASLSRIAAEHNFARLVPFRSSYGSGGKDSSFSTVVLFPDRVSLKHRSKKNKAKKQHSRVKGIGGGGGGRGVMMEDVLHTNTSHGEMSTEEGESGLTAISIDIEPADTLEGAGGMTR